MRTLLLTWTIALLAPLAACDREPGAAPAQPAATEPTPPDHGAVPGAPTGVGDASIPGESGRADLGAITFDVPAGWRAEQPSSEMRQAQFVLPGEAGDGSLVVFYFGSTGAGSVEDNLSRWCIQFVQPDASNSRDHAEIATSSDPLPMTTVWLTGRYVAETMPGSGERVDHADWALIGAIVDTPNGPYYFKAVGPEATMSAQRPAFEAMLATIGAP